MEPFPNDYRLPYFFRECIITNVHLMKNCVRASDGSCAMETLEPCQVRKEAALRDAFYVPQSNLSEAVIQLFY